MKEPTIHDKDYTMVQKIDHFWTYYKWHTIAVLFVVGVIISVITSVLSKKDVAIQVMAFDAGVIYDTDIARDFEAFADVDTKHQEVIAQMNGSLANESDYFAVANSAKIMANISANELDILMMDMRNYEQNMQDGVFMDLRDVFSEDELNKFSQLVVATDGKILGIKTDSLVGLSTYGYYQNGENAAAGIVSNSVRVDMAKEFLMFLNEKHN